MTQWNRPGRFLENFFAMFLPNGFESRSALLGSQYFGSIKKLVAGTETASGIPLRSFISPLEALTATLAQYCLCDCLTTLVSGLSWIHAVPAARIISTKYTAFHTDFDRLMFSGSFFLILGMCLPYKRIDVIKKTCFFFHRIYDRLSHHDVRIIYFDCPYILSIHHAKLFSGITVYPCR